MYGLFKYKEGNVFLTLLSAWFPVVTCLGSKGTRHDLYKVQNSFLDFFFISCLYMGVANHYIFNFECYFFFYFNIFSPDGTEKKNHFHGKVSPKISFNLKYIR